MDKGIYYHIEDNRHTLKLVGELRAIDSRPLDQFLSSLAPGLSGQRLNLDLCDTTYLDSTMLGMIGKLGMYWSDHYHSKPSVYYNNHDIKKMLDILGIVPLFMMSENAGASKTFEMIVSEDTKKDLHERVTQAHQTLIKIDPKNENEFKNLLKHLESKDIRPDE